MNKEMPCLRPLFPPCFPPPIHCICIALVNHYHWSTISKMNLWPADRCCATKPSWWDATLVSTYGERHSMTEQSTDTTKSPTWLTNKLYWCYLHSNGDGLLKGVETQRQLYRQGTLQQGWQLTKTGNLEHTVQLQAPQQVRECPFQVTQLIGGNLFQAARLVSGSSMELGSALLRGLSPFFA